MRSPFFSPPTRPISCETKTMAESPNLFHHYLREVENYLRRYPFAEKILEKPQEWQVKPLAKGEYNCNYLLIKGKRRLVFRVNIGSQINRCDQILYEYKALQLLGRSGVTPLAIHVDDSRSYLDRGILIMQYLPGRPLNYLLQTDLDGAAEAFAKIHQLVVPAEENHLIVEERPLSLIFDECERLLQHYWQSPHADKAIAAYLAKIVDWAHKARDQEIFFSENPWPCMVNTETNSGNFIVDEKAQKVFLVDWEMPRFGDPSTDLSHFCSPLTTLWKTSFRFSSKGRQAFLASYKKRLAPGYPMDSLDERMRRKDPFVYLRGISWSAYAWAAYQGDFAGIRNRDTWEKLNQYLQLPLIKDLFDPFLAGA